MLPTLQTNRLILKPRTMDDLKECVEMDLNPEVTQYIPGIWDGSQKHIAFLEERIMKSYPPELGYWSIFPKDNPLNFLGWVHLLPIQDEEQAVEIGWRLKRQEWDKGYATEAIQAILIHAFETTGTERMVANTHSANNRSRKLMEKLGFNYVSDFIYDGKIPSSSYEITKNKRTKSINI